MSFAYLHGFASGPGSRKARAFADRFASLGLELAVPSLDQGNFQRFTITRAREAVAATMSGMTSPRVLVGSSMGAWLALLESARTPVDTLVLLAPAVDFSNRWHARHHADELARWRSEGSRPFFHFGAKQLLPLDSAFLDDLAHHDALPAVTVPTLVFQGLRDDVVTPDATRRFVAANPLATLVELDSDHELGDALDTILRRTLAFLATRPAVVAAHPALAAH